MLNLVATCKKLLEPSPMLMMQERLLLIRMVKAVSHSISKKLMVFQPLPLIVRSTIIFQLTGSLSQDTLYQVHKLTPLILKYRLFMQPRPLPRGIQAQLLITQPRRISLLHGLGPLKFTRPMALLTIRKSRLLPLAGPVSLINTLVRSWKAQQVLGTFTTLLLRT